MRCALCTHSGLQSAEKCNAISSYFHFENIDHCGFKLNLNYINEFLNIVNVIKYLNIYEIIKKIKESLS